MSDRFDTVASAIMGTICHPADWKPNASIPSQVIMPLPDDQMSCIAHVHFLTIIHCFSGEPVDGADMCRSEQGMQACYLACPETNTTDEFCYGVGM